MKQQYCACPDRHEPKIECGYPLPCPHHTDKCGRKVRVLLVVDQKKRAQRKERVTDQILGFFDRGNVGDAAFIQHCLTDQHGRGPSEAQVRNALRYLHDRGALRRVARGTYKKRVRRGGPYKKRVGREN